MSPLTIASTALIVTNLSVLMTPLFMTVILIYRRIVMTVSFPFPTYPVTMKNDSGAAVFLYLSQCKALRDSLVALIPTLPESQQQVCIELLSLVSQLIGFAEFFLGML